MALKRPIRYRLEAAGVALLLGVFRLCPPDLASWLGAGFGRLVGRCLPAASARAARNLAYAMPELSAEARARAISGMWANLGRTLAELPHVATMMRTGRVEVEGAGELETLRADSIGGFLVSGHMANWEVLPHVSLAHGIPLHIVHRAQNNPFVEAMLARARAEAETRQVAKGAQGGRQVLTAIKAGHHVGILIDQKMNEGIAVPFFGRDAMTSPVIAQIALRYRVPIAMARCERLGGARLKVTVETPLDLPASGERNADALAVMTAVNRRLEDWIRERPEQWLWLHRRWPD